MLVILNKEKKNWSLSNKKQKTKEKKSAGTKVLNFFQPSMKRNSFVCVCVFDKETRNEKNKKQISTKNYNQ